MIKCVGAVMILISAVFFGVWPAAMQYKREETLRQWGHVLQRMKSELRTNLSDVPTLLSNSLDGTDNECTAVVMAVLKDIQSRGTAFFSESWKNHVLQQCSFFQEPEREAVCELGNILGNYVPEDELNVLDRVCALLSESATVCSHQRKEKTKLYMGTAVTLGLILVVVLL